MKKKDWLFVGILALITTVHLVGFFDTKLPAHDVTTAYLPFAENIKQSIQLGDWWNLWTPYGFSGTPFLMKPYLGIDSLLGIMLLLIPKTVIALKLTYVLLILISGITMYAFLVSLDLERVYALIGALVYMLNGHITKLLTYGWLTTIGGYAIMPLAWMYGMKALKGDKHWIKNSVLAGVVFAIMFRLNPDVKVVAWFSLMFGLYIVYTLILNHSKENVKKVVLISCLIAILFLGLSAQRILTNAQYIEQTSRGETPWEQASGRKLAYDKFIPRLIQPIPSYRGLGTGDYLGIVAALLAGYAIIKRGKDKRVFFFAISALVSILISTNTFNLYYLIWKYIPFFNSLRYLDRSLFLFVFAGSVLAALGAREFCAASERGKKWAYGIAALIVLNLAVFSFTPYSNGGTDTWVDTDAALQGNDALQFIGQQPGIFRINTWETRGIDWGTDFYNIPLRLEHIFRYDTMWETSYMNEYLSVAYNNPAKMWGMLNLKYLTSQQAINISGFTLIKKAKECTVCFPATPEFAKAWGPYVYENQEFLPRAYLVNQSILVVGKEDAVTQATYTLILQPEFDPENTVIIRGKSTLDAYSRSELDRYSAILLLDGSLGPLSNALLTSFSKKGGIILPSILEGKQSFGQEEITALLSKFTGNLLPIPDTDIQRSDFDHTQIKVGNSKGWLVVSEKYSIFDGWKSTIDHHNANAMNTAVYLSGDEPIVSFAYEPALYRVGSIITLITLLCVLLFFGFNFFKRKQSTGEPSTTHEKLNPEHPA